jgi:Transposase DDE domain
VTPKFVSPSDPAARWTGAMRGPAFFAYADNYLIDVEYGIIVDVEATRAIRQAEVGAAKTMIERTEERFDLKPAYLAADTAYGSAETLNWIVNEKKIARTFRSSTNQNVKMGLSRERTSRLTRNATSTSARITSCCTPLERCTTATRFAIAPPNSIVASARSKCSAVPTCLHDTSLAISTKMLAMSLVH